MLSRRRGEFLIIVVIIILVLYLLKIMVEMELTFFLKSEEIRRTLFDEKVINK